MEAEKSHWSRNTPNSLIHYKSRDDSCLAGFYKKAEAVVRFHKTVNIALGIYRSLHLMNHFTIHINLKAKRG
jgi:hypothetical protein